MATLYVDHRNARLRAEGGVLALYRGDERVRTVPLALLDRVILFGNAQLDGTVLGAVARHGVTLALCSARDPQRWGIFTGPLHKDARLRIGQVRWFFDPDRRLKAARFIVRAKIVRYRRFLIRAERIRPDARRPLHAALATLGEAAAAARSAPDLDTLRGIEGAAARVSFGAYAHLLPPELGFERRRRRPPPDPANALLSLAYTLLHLRAHALLHTTGFDPAIGMLHEPAHGRPSAAADLVEPWRAAVDEWVWRLFAERVFTRDDFRRDGGACLLAKRGRREFYPRFECWVRPVERAMRHHLRHLARRLFDEMPEWRSMGEEGSA